MVKRIGCTGVRNVVSTNESEELTSDFINAAREIEEVGASAVITTCSLIKAFQKKIDRQVSIPVPTSSLLQIKLIENALLRYRKVGTIMGDS